MTILKNDIQPLTLMSPVTYVHTYKTVHML